MLLCRRPLTAVPLAVLAAAAAFATVVLGGSPATASASPAEPGAGRSAPAQYLALGDSVPFGYSPLVPIGSDPARYTGYPDLVSVRLRLPLTNLSCPGEASGGFVSATGADNGCRLFKFAGILHTPYLGTQLNAATAFLREHPQTTLVTLMVGANDLLLCESSTGDRCVSSKEVGDVLSAYAANLEKVLSGIRAIFGGRIVLVSYYSTDYTDARVTASVRALNGVTTAAAARHRAAVADGYRAFSLAAARFGGSACGAGLLIRRASGVCDLHPSPAGARLLAAAVSAAAKAPAHEDAGRAAD